MASADDLALMFAQAVPDVALWDQAVRRLRALTRADLAFQVACSADLPAPIVHVAAGETERYDPARARRELERLGVGPESPLRWNRSYGFDEVRPPGARNRRGEQAPHLCDMHGRLIRTASRSGHHCWLLVARRRADFGGAESALLSAVAPHVAAAVDNRLRLDAVVLGEALARSTLARSGIGQIAFDAAARVVAFDGVADRALQRLGIPTPVLGQKLALKQDALQRLEAACGDPQERLLVIRSNDDFPLELLLRRGPGRTGCRAAVLVATMLDRAAGPPVSPRLVADLYGLSSREAQLAVSMAQGLSILDAGARHGLTAETARNYSKRIYAKTGARGQADLVRLLLTGLAAL